MTKEYNFCTPEEIEFIHANKGKMSYKKIGEAIGKSDYCVWKHANGFVKAENMKLNRPAHLRERRRSFGVSRYKKNTAGKYLTNKRFYFTFSIFEGGI